MDTKIFQDNFGEIPRTEKEIEVVGLNRELLDGDYRRRAGCGTEAREDQTLRDASGMREIGRVKLLKRDGGGKSGLQGLRNARLRKGPMAGKKNGENGKRQQECGQAH